MHATYTDNNIYNGIQITQWENGKDELSCSSMVEWSSGTLPTRVQFLVQDLPALCVKW
jgi:hypothetical protein